MGDTENLRAITSKLSSQFIEQTIKTEFYQDCDPDAISLINANLDQDQQHILLISGTHGLEFLNAALKNPKIQSLIKDKKLIVSWGGHQAPKDLKTLESNLMVVSLVQESIDKSLEDTFGSRLVSTKMVPNTLNNKTLTLALIDWHKKNPSQEDSIPDSTNGYIGVFLGGDAPDEDGNHKCYTADEAFAQGRAFGLEAKKTDKILLVTNGPRMGKIYPESPDPKHPILTRINDKGQWVAFEDLTDSERNTDPSADFKAHATKAPVDPVSAAFIAGIQSSGLTVDQYRFIDFRFGKSAYQAIISALYANKDSSVAFYSGESVSYAEIGYFIPKTYAFEVGSMSNRHKNILARFSQDLHLVGKVDFIKDGIKFNDIDYAKKQQTLMLGTDQDAQIIADTLFALVSSLHADLAGTNVGNPLVWMVGRDNQVSQTADVKPETNVAKATKSYKFE